jgi:hypothetical protein
VRWRSARNFPEQQKLRQSPPFDTAGSRKAIKEKKYGPAAIATNWQPKSTTCPYLQKKLRLKNNSYPFLLY